MNVLTSNVTVPIGEVCSYEQFQEDIDKTVDEKRREGWYQIGNPTAVLTSIYAGNHFNCIILTFEKQDSEDFEEIETIPQMLTKNVVVPITASECHILEKSIANEVDKKRSEGWHQRGNPTVVHLCQTFNCVILTFEKPDSDDSKEGNKLTLPMTK